MHIDVHTKFVNFSLNLYEVGINEHIMMLLISKDKRLLKIQFVFLRWAVSTFFFFFFSKLEQFVQRC